jgi:hypothetical protein
MCPPETTYWLLAEQGEHYVAYVRNVTDKVTIKFGPDAVDLRRASLFDPRTGEKKSVDKNTLLKDRYEWSPPDSGDWVLHLARSAELDGGKYLKAVQDFADVIIEKGRDTYRAATSTIRQRSSILGRPSGLGPADKPPGWSIRRCP